MPNIFRETRQQEEKELICKPVDKHQVNRLYSNLARQKTNHPQDKTSASKRLRICDIDGKIRYASISAQLLISEGKPAASWSHWNHVGYYRSSKRISNPENLPKACKEGNDDRGHLPQHRILYASIFYTCTELTTKNTSHRI